MSEVAENVALMERFPTGQLDKDSPALSATLKRIGISDLTFAACKRCYKVAAEHGESERSIIVRPAGVNFNPWQARIVQIAVESFAQISQGENRPGYPTLEFNVLSALLSCHEQPASLESIAKALSPSFAEHTEFPKVVQLGSAVSQQVAQLIQSNAAPLSSAELRTDPTYCLILGCQILDLVRHLHMTSLAAAQRVSCLQSCSAAVAELSISPLPQQLLLKVQKAIERGKI